MVEREQIRQHKLGSDGKYLVRNLANVVGVCLPPQKPERQGAAVLRPLRRSLVSRAPPSGEASMILILQSQAMAECAARVEGDARSQTLM